MRRNYNLFFLLAIGVALASCKPGTATPATATATQPQKAETVEIRWFTGLGIGSDPNQQKSQQAVVDAFNQTVGKQKNIHLTLEVVSSSLAQATLAARIADGEAPDIVGPTGLAESNAFHDQWLDLDPNIMMTGFDTSMFSPSLMELYQTRDGTTALPFAAYPSVVFYNVSLFKRFGYAYPPDRHTKGYLMPDGMEVEWTWDALAALARLMTIDGTGLNTTDLDFNPQDIRQYGFTWQAANHPNYWGAYWSSGSIWNEAGKSAETPKAWKDAWQWTYDAIWSDPPFLADASVEDSSAFGYGKPFTSGKAAMTAQPFSSACCLGQAGSWDIAILPSYNGTISGRVEEAAFRILKSSPHPEEAFTVLQYLVTTAVDTLLIGDDKTPKGFDAVPALISAQQAWKTANEEIYPTVYNLDAVLDSLNYTVVPSGGERMPNYPEAWARGIEFADRLRSTPGLDLAIETKIYEDALTAIFTKP